ncbi:MAG: hypothetical protein RL653_3065 [Pseudomonadota bacterium]
MSRVDDDRQAQRATERLALQKREQELKAKERSTQESAFSRLVGQGNAQKQVAQERPGQAAQSAIAKLRASLAESGEKAHAFSEAQARASKDGAADSSSRMSARTSAQAQGALAEAGRQADGTGQALHADARSQGEAASGMAARDRAAEGGASAGRSSERAQQGRSADSARTREGLEEKATGQSQGGRGAAGAGRSGDERVQREGNQGGGQKGGDNKDGAGGAPASFRFNPALMSPVPVAQKRDLAGSDRLRRLANEIAQKIVERVRVGTNKAGASEFQIDLRQDVLAGLSIKVASKHGRISMVFSGRDGETLKALEGQAEGLKDALQQRGLRLEDMKFERVG